MEAVKSTTAAKMKALREAKKLGCSGAHQTSDGLWHPCSSAESLAKIIPSDSSANQRLNSTNVIRREQRGTNRVRRQWEQLGSRGIVSIDTLHGGGLVSGVVSKEYQPAAPRDEDPDVFTDIEVARDRSRQLGCIGVSRRTSRSGRTIWMPCTNMTDLANRTGRTALGRRNMQKRTERFIADVVRRSQPKATRSRKKTLYDDLHGDNNYNVKGLGPKVGRRIGRGLRAAPNGFVFVDITGAIDGDKDGIVFEGLPLERPIIPRFMLPESAARRVQKLISETAVVNEQSRRSGLSGAGEIDQNLVAQITGETPKEIPSTRQDSLLLKLRNTLANKKPAQSYSQRRVEDDDDTEPFGDADLEISSESLRRGKREGMSFVGYLDDVGDEYEYLDSFEIRELVAAMTPTSDEELLEALKSSPFTKKNAKQINQRILDSAPDYETTKEVRRILTEEFQKNPGLRNAIRRYGMPPIVVTGFEPDIDNMGFLNVSTGARPWFSVMGGYAPRGFIAFTSGVFLDPETGRVRDSRFKGEDLDLLLRHELSHAWQFMAARQGGDAREYLILQYQELLENMKQGRKTESSVDFGPSEYRSVTWGSEQERQSARKISAYAETARIEWFAESLAHFTDDSPQKRASVDAVSIANMAHVLGMSVNDFMLFMGQREDSQLSERARIPSLRSASNLLLGEMSKPEKEVFDWLQKNPDYIADAPDRMLLRIPPDTLNTFVRNQRLSTRSRYDTDVSNAKAKAEEARENEELGQQIIDSIFERAQGANATVQPTMWFIGGTTGSGKSTLRDNGSLTGVPSPDTAINIDPDVIKSMHPDWDGGRGASAIHGWSTQWAIYGMRQATADNRDFVVTGTGVRVDQMLIGRNNGYRTVGHYVHVPVGIAEKRMTSRAQEGGVNLPKDFASQYSSELKYKVHRAITNGYLDEFYLWDNAQDGGTPSLAVIRRDDGTYEILNRTVFEEFFGQQGAQDVESYWKKHQADQVSGTILASTRSSLRSSSQAYDKKFLPDITEIDNHRPTLLKVKTFTSYKDYETSFLRHVIFEKGIDLSTRNWNGSEWHNVRAENLSSTGALNFFNTSLQHVSFKDTEISPTSTFKRSILKGVSFDETEIDDVDFSESIMQGVDFSKAKVKNINLGSSVLEHVIFDEADLTQSGLTVEQITQSGLVWTSKTKFSPEIQEYILAQQSAGKLVFKNGKFSFQTRASVVTQYTSAGDGYAKARKLLLPPRVVEINIPDDEEEVIRNIRSVRELITETTLTKLKGRKIRRAVLRGLAAQGQNWSAIEITQSNLNGINLNGATLDGVVLRRNSLVGAHFDGVKIKGNLDLKSADLRGASFVGAKILASGLPAKMGNIDFTGSVLTGLDLGTLPLARLKFSEDAELKDVIWEGPTSQIPRDLHKLGLRGTRSMSTGGVSGLDSHMLDLNERLSNLGKMSIRDKEELSVDVADTYRQLLDIKISQSENLNLLDMVNGLVAKYDANLKKFNAPNSSGKQKILIDAVNAEDKNLFLERFNKIRATSPDFMREYSSIQAWRAARDAVGVSNGLMNFQKELDKDFYEQKTVAQSLPRLQNLLHGEFLDGKNLKGSNGKLPSGKRDKTPIVSTRSSRSTTLEKLSDEEIRALAKREGISEEGLKGLYKTIVGARDFIRRSKNKPLSHAPGLSEETAKRMRDSIRVETAPNGVPMIIAEPFQAVIDEVPDKRDWSKVLAPSLEDMQRLVDAVREAQDSNLPRLERLSEESSDRIINTAYNVGSGEVDSPFNKIKARVLAKLGSSEDEWVPISSGGVGAIWVDTYLKSLAYPESMHAAPGSDGMHDFFGHFGVGRGFDRHGEWAAALVTDSLIRDRPEFDFLTLDEREWLRREFFNEGAGALVRLSSQLETEFERRFGKSRYDPTAEYTPEEIDVKKLFDDIQTVVHYEFPPYYIEDPRPYLSMDAILDALGVPPSTTRPEARNGARGMASTRSSRNSIPFTEANDKLLLSIAGNEAVIKKERSMRSTRSSRREMTDSEKQRLKPVSLEVNEKMKFQPGVTLVYTDRDDRVIRTELVGPQVLRIRGVDGVNVYVDPTPDNQAEIDARMRQWEIDYGPVSSPSRQAQNTGGQSKRDSRERDRPQKTVDEDPMDRIDREVEEYKRKKQEVPKAWRNLSTRSRTDTYAILDGRDFEDILNELELNDSEKDIARQALLDIYYEDNNLLLATRQKEIDKIKNLLSDNPYSLATPIDEKTKEAIKSISIKVSSNGIPVIFAQPHPIIGSILPNRDWSEIEAPSTEYLKSIFRELKYKIKSKKTTSYKNKLRIGSATERSYEAEKILREKFNKQFRDIVKKIQGHDFADEYKEFKQLRGSWIQQYAGLLLNPARGSTIPDVEHDILGHFGTGRGFDRHGEWANAMALTSFILDSDLFDLTEEERDAMAFYWLGEYGIPQIFKQTYPERETSEELQGVVDLLGKIRFGEFDDAFDGSARELIALLDAENINRESNRSKSTRSVKLTEASPELLLQAEKEASKDRSEFVLKSTLENLSTRPDKNKIINGTPRSKPRSGGRISKSSRSTQSVITRTPQMAISEDGSKTIMDAGEKGAFLSDAANIIDGMTEADIPSGYFQKGETNQLGKYKDDLMTLTLFDSLVQNEDGAGVSARNLFGINTRFSQEFSMLLRKDARKGLFSSERTERIFHQADVNSLATGEALLVTDIPESKTMTAIDNALVIRNSDGTLTLLEVTEEEVAAIKTKMGQVEPRLNDNGVGLFQSDDIKPENPQSRISQKLSFLENYHTTIADVDPRIPRPNIILKADYYSAKAPYGLDVKRIAGTAYPELNSVVYWRNGNEEAFVDIMLHELGHSIDFTLGYRTVMDDAPISYSSAYPLSSTTDDWSPAMSSDQAHGLIFGAMNPSMTIALADNPKAMRQPTGIPGTGYEGNIAPSVDEEHSPLIGSKFITRYASATDAYTEDFAEAISLFLRDKMFGYAIEVQNPRTGETQRRTFADLYPNRAKVLEGLLYGNQSKGPTDGPASTSNRSSTGFNNRFKNSYGSAPVDGAGDCYQSAVDTAQRLVGEKFGFSDSQVRVVHGIPLGTGGDAMGIRYGHAWAEVAKDGWEEYENLRTEIANLLAETGALTSKAVKDGIAARYNKLMRELIRMELEDITVYDFSNGNNHVFPRYLYYKMGNLDNDQTRYYSRRDASLKMLANEHYGPWE